VDYRIKDYVCNAKNKIDLMKKIITMFTVIACLGMTNQGMVKAQAVEQGNIMVTPQYGWPNIFNMVIKTEYSNSGYTGLDVGGLGPVGLQFEFMVSDKIGVGLKSNYSSTSIAYDENTTIYDSFGNPSISSYNYKIKISRFRIMPRFAIHFGNSSNFDAYFGVAAGYSSFKVSYESNDPDYDGDLSVSNPIPVGVRFDIGGNYFFTDFLGINFELGLGGGPVLNGGVVLKF